jgi:hypothetical protein
MTQAGHVGLEFLDFGDEDALLHPQLGVACDVDDDDDDDDGQRAAVQSQTTS